MSDNSRSTAELGRYGAALAYTDQGNGRSAPVSDLHPMPVTVVGGGDGGSGAALTPATSYLIIEDETTEVALADLIAGQITGDVREITLRVTRGQLWWGYGSVEDSPPLQPGDYVQFSAWEIPGVKVRTSSGGLSRGEPAVLASSTGGLT